MPIRIYGWDKFYVVTSDIAIPPEAISPLSRCITEYAVSKNVKLVISLGGIAAPNRLEIKKPKVYGVASGKEAKEVLDKAGIEPLSEGVIVGTYAMILKECLMRRVPSIILLAQAHSHYPDPGAAASVLEALSKILGIEIDVAPLLKEEEDLRLKLRELMRRTSAMLSRIQKAHEYEVPPTMYV